MNFYLDSLRGADSNDGMTEATPWRSLEKAHERTYKPGDRICFRRGGQWDGMFHPAGSGTAEAPIVIDAYGDGERPRIDGRGAKAAVYLYHVDYWVVQGLCCSNTAKERATRSGIMVMGRPYGMTKGICIRDCEVTEVYGENRRTMPIYRSMYWNGGIYISFPDKCTAENHLEDILIEQNYIHDVHTSGIRVNQEEDFCKDIWHTNVVVRGNRIARTGSDGIIVANCIRPLIEYNRCYDAGALGNKQDTFLIAGVWVCATKDALIQYNEVARTRLFDNDGTAFDTDWGVAGTTVFQYNYTHENEGGFWLDCTALNRNEACGGTVLRGNVSINDKRCLVQSDTGELTRFEENSFVQTAEGIELCTQAEGASHQYCRNVFAFLHEPATGWKQSAFEGNAYRCNPPERDVSAVADTGELLETVAALPCLDGMESCFGLDFSAGSNA